MKKNTLKLRLNKETLHVLEASSIRQAAGGAPSDSPTDCIMNDDTGGGGTGGSITCSVPFCQTLYPNTCASIGCG